MQVEIIQGSKVLQCINHNGQSYIEAPESGAYTLRLTNNAPNRRLAVVTIDGININTGMDGSTDGSGYVLAPWQSVTLKGWLRSNNEVAAFEFKPNEASYAAGTGRGTKNTGIIGVAVFDEKPRPVKPLIHTVHHHHHHHNKLGGSSRWKFTCSIEPNSSASNEMPPDEVGTLCSEEPICALPPGGEATASVMPPASANAANAADYGHSGMLRSRGLSSSVDLGTGYGQRMTQYTSTVDFERATTSPVYVVTLRYAVRAKLQEWGVPVPEVHVTTAPPAPNPFPASSGFAQPPPGWRG